MTRSGSTGGKLAKAFLAVLVLWHGAPCSASRTKVRGSRQDTAISDDDESVRRLARSYPGNRAREGTSGRADEQTDEKDEPGFLSGGFFGSFSEYTGPSGQGENEGSNTNIRPPITQQTGGNSHEGAHLSTYSSYYGSSTGGQAFQGGFPIRCRTRKEERMKGIVKKGKRGNKGGMNGNKGKKGQKGGMKYSDQHDDGYGKGKGKAGKYESRNKNKSRGKGGSKGSKGKGGSKEYRNSGSSQRGGLYGGQTGGFLSRARYFRGVSNQEPREGPARRRSGLVSVRRQDILLMECYFGAFPPFSGFPDTIPTVPAKPPSIAPSQALPTTSPGTPPSQSPSTAAPTTADQTSAPTISPTLSPTVAPTAATMGPTSLTAAPSISTVSPTAPLTGSPTRGLTGSPTGVTAGPTVAATLAPTAAPRPVGPTTNTSLLSLLNYGYFGDANVNRAPKEEEINGLIGQTVAFYTELFAETYGDDFVMFQFQLNNATNNFDNDLPFTMDFDAVVSFGESIAATPTPRDVFLVMETTPAQYERYIEDFVWESPPEGSIFFDVMQVTFRAKEGQF